MPIYQLAPCHCTAVEYPDSIERVALGKRKPPPQLDRPYQIEAVDNIISGFQTADRGQLIMACGTGKTFVCLWVKERLKAKRTLVLVRGKSFETIGRNSILLECNRI